MAKVERTSDQVLVTVGVDGELGKVDPKYGWNKIVRQMRRDPTLGLVRDLYQAPILTSPWTVVSDDDEKYKKGVDFLYEQLCGRWRSVILKNVVRGLLDFGWQGFEFVVDASSGQKKIQKIKPLLQDITTILVEKNGAFYGLRNRPTYLNTLGSLSQGPWCDLVASECLLFNRDVEGTNWYGDSLMIRAHGPWTSWNDCEASAQRFDKKIAGAHWVVYYPIGYSRYKGQEDVDNYVIANDILAAMESSGKFVVPRVLAGQIDDLNSLSEDKLAWKIEILSASTTSAQSFVERQKYLDALKARGIGVPERAVFEGQFGTKAEAEAHADFAIDNIEMAHSDIVQQVNEQASNPLLRDNFGEEFLDKVRVKASPLSDARRLFLKELYMKHWEDETGKAEEEETVDWPAVREEMDVPVLQDSNRKPTQEVLPSKELVSK